MLKFIEIEKKEELEIIWRWNQNEDAYLSTPSFILEKKRTVDDMWDAYKSTEKNLYLVEYNGEIVGEVSYDFSFPLLLKKDKKTAWIGIVIGEKSARGKGIGRLAMEFLEDKVKSLGAQRIELGCFEFNERAFALYKKLGYIEIGLLENITFYKGKWWHDIRMEKSFE